MVSLKIQLTEPCVILSAPSGVSTPSNNFSGTSSVNPIGHSSIVTDPSTPILDHQTPNINTHRKQAPSQDGSEASTSLDSGDENRPSGLLYPFPQPHQASSSNCPNTITTTDYPTPSNPSSTITHSMVRGYVILDLTETIHLSQFSLKLLGVSQFTTATGSDYHSSAKTTLIDQHYAILDPASSLASSNTNDTSGLPSYHQAEQPPNSACHSLSTGEDQAAPLVPPQRFSSREFCQIPVVGKDGWSDIRNSYQPDLRAKRLERWSNSTSTSTSALQNRFGTTTPITRRADKYPVGVADLHCSIVRQSAFATRLPQRLRTRSAIHLNRSGGAPVLGQSSVGKQWSEADFSERSESKNSQQLLVMSQDSVFDEMLVDRYNLFMTTGTNTTRSGSDPTSVRASSSELVVKLQTESIGVQHDSDSEGLLTPITPEDEVEVEKLEGLTMNSSPNKRHKLTAPARRSRSQSVLGSSVSNLIDALRLRKKSSMSIGRRSLSVHRNRTHSTSSHHPTGAGMSDINMTDNQLSSCSNLNGLSHQDESSEPEKKKIPSPESNQINDQLLNPQLCFGFRKFRRSSFHQLRAKNSIFSIGEQQQAHHHHSNFLEGFSRNCRASTLSSKKQRRNLGVDLHNYNGRLNIEDWDGFGRSQVWEANKNKEEEKTRLIEGDGRKINKDSKKRDVKKKIELQAGVYKYPIVIGLPECLPPSLKCKSGSICYNLEVELEYQTKEEEEQEGKEQEDRKMKKIKESREIKLVDPRAGWSSIKSLNNLGLEEDIMNDIYNSYSGISIERMWDDQLFYSIKMNSRKFLVGGKLNFEIQFNPLSNMKIYKFQVDIEEKTQYYKSHEKKNLEQCEVKTFKLKKLEHLTPIQIINKNGDQTKNSTNCLKLKASDIPLLPIISNDIEFLKKSPLISHVIDDQSLNDNDEQENGIRILKRYSEESQGIWKLKFDVRLPKCFKNVEEEDDEDVKDDEKEERGGLNFTCNHFKSCFVVKHYLKLRMRVERGDDEALDKKGRRKRYDIILSSPIQIFSCHCLPYSLPSYSQFDSIKPNQILSTFKNINNLSTETPSASLCCDSFSGSSLEDHYLDVDRLNHRYCNCVTQSD